ncbi:MAG: GDSL-type esterase/lipase family protein, partial [Chitinophagaceae bacterium]
PPAPARGGENAPTGEARFKEEVLNHKPDVLFIDYALNDRSLGLVKARQAWQSMIEEATRRHIKLILLTPSPDQRVDIIAPGNELEQHAAQIRQLAISYKTGFVDPFGLFQEKIKNGEKIADYMSSVNHPNKKGHEIIADQIMKSF